MMPSREHFLLNRRNALSRFSLSPTLIVDIFQPSFASALNNYHIITSLAAIVNFFRPFSRHFLKFFRLIRKKFQRVL